MKVTATLIIAAAALGSKVALAAPVVEHQAGVDTVVELMARGNAIVSLAFLADCCPS